MWVPRDAEQIERAARSGELAETSSFDAKRELPANSKRNADLAVDVAAMSTDGGVLLFGVGEDQHKRPTNPVPFMLAGVADRISQIVATSIMEVPYIDVREYPSAEDPARGYVAVIVPQSPRAPHQVTVGGDLRYYGRSANGNRRLTEGEVARLYERRQSWAVDREALLARCVAAAPLEPHATIGYVHAFARPVAPDEELWDRAAAAHGDQAALRSALLSAAASSPVMGTFDPSLGNGGLDWQPQGADAWRMSKWRIPDYDDPSYTADPGRLAEATINIDGSGRMFCGRATDVPSDGRPVVMEVIIAGNVGAFLAMMGALYEAAGYLGQVDVGVAATNVRGAGSLRMRESFGARSYGAPTFKRTARLAAAELLDHEQRTRDLLGRFFEAASGLVGYDPFTDGR